MTEEKLKNPNSEAQIQPSIAYCPCSSTAVYSDNIPTQTQQGMLQVTFPDSSQSFSSAQCSNGEICGGYDSNMDGKQHIALRKETYKPQYTRQR